MVLGIELINAASNNTFVVEIIHSSFQSLITQQPWEWLAHCSFRPPLTLLSVFFSEFSVISLHAPFRVPYTICLSP